GEDRPRAARSHGMGLPGTDAGASGDRAEDPAADGGSFTYRDEGEHGLEPRRTGRRGGGSGGGDERRGARRGSSARLRAGRASLSEGVGGRRGHRRPGTRARLWGGGERGAW